MHLQILICKGEFACAAIGGAGGDGGEGGRGGDTGDAIAGDIGPGGSCLAISATIGDNCGGSTGSSEPRSGSGDNSMNGWRRWGWWPGRRRERRY